MQSSQSVVYIVTDIYLLGAEEVNKEPAAPDLCWFRKTDPLG